MRLLIVTHTYAPQLAPRAFRWSTIVEYWAEAGHEVDVVCGWSSGLPRRERRGGVAVHRAGGAVLESLRHRLQKPAAVQEGGAARGASGRVAQRLARAARIVHDATWKQLYWPDYACTSFAAARQRAQALLAAHSYDAMITVSHPFTPHLVGAALRRRQLPWIADVGDPFAFLQGEPLNNRRLYSRLNYAAEERVLASATAITVTTESTRRSYAQHFPRLAGKLCVVPPLLSLPAPDAAQPRFFPLDDRLRIVFTGTLYRGLRSPEVVLRLFERLLMTRVGPRLELHFLGDINGCDDYFERYAHLQGIRIFCHGKLPRADAARAMQEAAVLVNLGNGSREQLPSKVVEYVSTGRPVLNVAAAEEDSSTEFFRNYSGAFLLSREAAANGTRLEELVDFIENARAAPLEEVRDLTRPYQVEAVAGAYEELIGASRGCSRRAEVSP